MKATAVIHMNFLSDKCAGTVFKALEPEIEKPPTKRYRATLTKEDETLILRIEAEDTVALRASANAYLRWISAINDCLTVLQDACAN